MRPILVIGAAGMLGRDLMDELASRKLISIGMDVGECDITNARACVEAMKSCRPSSVINCAAYTDVNRAESEQEKAFEVNGAGAGNVARACAEAGARCLYISTDYVFDGHKDAPYVESDAANPMNVYGASKLEGERQTAGATPNHVIARASWLYGRHGKNFVTTILAAARRGVPLRVVDDQRGAPTWTRDLARLLADLACHDATGIFHAPNSGECTWFGFAREIFELSGVQPVSLASQSAAEYVSPAARPANSRLADTRLAALGIAPMPDWENALTGFLREIGESRA
ncbi:MAG: dTDP-4-dehydrorhamnose reductase [bacterium]